MPEIAEVARAAHHLRQHLLHKTISNVVLRDNYSSSTSPTANEDNDAKIFQTAKTGLTARTFAEKLKGKKCTGVGTQGKFFYVGFEGNVTWIGHFGMNGWIKFKGDGGAGEYAPMKEKKNREKAQNGEGSLADEQDEDEEWPPKFWKFILQTSEKPKVEAAFVDSRRFSAVRLIECPFEEVRNHPPLNENGPDPVIDRKSVTLEWFTKKVNAKKVPIKALLLDQRVLSGVGNWVADEILFQARIHPEQYSNALADQQIKALYEKLLDVTKTACDVLADSSKFPENWIMKYRWDKGKNTVSKLPTGEKIVHLTVGGRTSAVVPSLQRKTGPVAGDVEDRGSEEEVDEKKSNVKASSRTKPGGLDQDDETKHDTSTKANGRGTKRKPKAEPEEPPAAEEKKPSKGRKTKSVKIEESNGQLSKDESANGRRRSARLR